MNRPVILTVATIVLERRYGGSIEGNEEGGIAEGERQRQRRKAGGYAADPGMGKSGVSLVLGYPLLPGPQLRLLSYLQQSASPVLPAIFLIVSTPYPFSTASRHLLIRPFPRQTCLPAVRLTPP